MENALTANPWVNFRAPFEMQEAGDDSSNLAFQGLSVAILAHSVAQRWGAFLRLGHFFVYPPYMAIFLYERRG